MAERPHQHLRTDHAYNLHHVRAQDCDEDGMPILHPDDLTPSDLIAWNACRTTTTEHPDLAVHFFIDDYRFESVWNRPERTLARLRNYGCVLTPDFSLYRDMPLPMQRWNVYRSRAIGNYWQREGLRVIPTLQWSTPDSFEFALGGLTPGAVFAVSTVGCRRDPVATHLWAEGMAAALETLEPSAILLYGDEIPFDFGDTEVHKFENKVIRRLENGRTRRAEQQQ